MQHPELVDVLDVGQGRREVSLRHLFGRLRKGVERLDGMLDGQTARHVDQQQSYQHDGAQHEAHADTYCQLHPLGHYDTHHPVGMLEWCIEDLHHRAVHLRLGDAGVACLHISDHALSDGVGLDAKLPEQVVVEDA